MEGTMGAVDRAAGQESGMPDIGTRVEWYRSVSLKDAETYISENLKAAARNVIAIGYYLKHIRDRELYQEAGYTDIWAYAHDRYGFSKSTTSRYMSRNDKFSRNGDSPILDDKYRDYGKAQLQEMLSLDEEQLERVTPDMTARQIREMKKPKEAPVPYVELPGQIELLDLLSDPMEDKGDGQVMEDQQGRCTVVSVSDLLPGTEERTPVATSQQEELSAYGTPRKVYPEGSLLSTEGCEDGDSCFSCALDCRIRQRYRYCVEAPLGAPFPCSMMDQMGALRDDKGDCCQFINPDLAHHCAGNGAPSPCCKRCDEICDLRCARSKKSTSEPAEEAVATSQQDEHSSCPPQVSGCRRQEWGTNPEQQQAGQKECAECWAEWKERQRVLGAAGTQQAADPAAGLRSGTMRIEADREQRADKEDDTKKVGADPQGEGDGIRDRIPCDTCEHNGECAGKKTHSDGCMGYEESSVEGHGLTASEGDAKGISVKAYDKRMLEEMIERCEGELEIMQEYWVQHLPNAYTEHMMQLRAYQDLLAAEAEEEPAEEPIGKPPLPVLKNDDQRKAWLDKFREWPVWFEVPQAAEKYYRYDLEDGYSLVICEYHRYITWMEKMGDMSPERTGTREYLLEPGYRYLYDCQANRAAMIQHLKALQKRGGAG